ncbi:hypothetical protein ElyMa_006095500 [Elysia marginata]|uniref:Uncharacterized protein n=1 Tax=Elysia marginata TaxID=1093978 RepID=A0AAV4GQS3_9GAST|nr:hypothetical protein ElyMa_006095500 [Elysia marginata]
MIEAQRDIQSSIFWPSDSTMILAMSFVQAQSASSSGSEQCDIPTGGISDFVIIQFKATFKSIHWRKHIPLPDFWVNREIAVNPFSARTTTTADVLV